MNGSDKNFDMWTMFEKTGDINMYLIYNENNATHAQREEVSDCPSSKPTE